jgi:hypothetical protein
MNKYVQGSQRGVPAEVHLNRGGKPPQTPGVTDLTNKSSFGDTHLVGDEGEFGIRYLTLEEHYYGGISTLIFVDESIHPPDLVTKTNVY